MSSTLVWILTIFSSAYFIFVVATWQRTKSARRLILELVPLAVFIFLAWKCCDFPFPKETFAGTTPIFAVGVMLLCAAAGIAARYFYTAQTFSWLSFLKPFCITPLVVFQLWGAIRGSQQVSPDQLVTFCFLSFQNGFFWKAVLEQIKRAKPK